MKSVLISINPRWCELIASGKKTVEVRKTRPKLETPFKCFIYCTNGKPILGRCLKDNSLKETPEIDFDNYNRDTLFKANGKVIGEFVCDKVYDLKLLPKEYYGKPAGTFEQFICENSCLPFDDIKAYGNEKNIYGWHISDLVIYDKPRKLSEFRYHCRYEFDDDYKHCEGCYYYYYSNTPIYGIEEYCSCDGLKMLRRPPQSWCYVESERE